MSRTRPATTGYERLAQAEQLSESDEDDVGFGAGDAAAALADANPRYATANGAQPRPVHGMSSSGNNRRPPYQNYQRRRRANSGVDLKAINARLERWADEIAAKFKRNQKQRGQEDEERLEIHYSVFHPPEGMRCLSAEALARTAAFGPEATDVPDSVITEDEFETIVDSVRTAIRQGTHPTMISQGSSGSYFARNTAGKVVGVFKPKDEEPYAAGNPKWNKWIHRNLFPCFFGRACLIPNLSYVSEAAAYVLDAQLRTYMVPYTDVVYLSSKAFHYPFWDRYSHSRNRKPLPAKPGSFQVFLKGFKDANIFLREHPWPDQYLSGFRTRDRNRSGRQRRWADNCRPTAKSANSNSSRSRRSPRSGAAGGSDDADDSGEFSDYDDGSAPEPTLGPDNFMWTEHLKQSFREELEKLVILDYIMRNTDRGLDNWMIKVDWSTQEVSIASEPIQLNMDNATPKPGQEGGEQGPRPVDLSNRPAGESRTSAPYPSYRAHQPMDATTPPAGNSNVPHPKISIGAIDNSLSWPWKHPDAWRSFPFGWLFLPVDLIGRPFSKKTRDHFLPLLTSPAWWSQTQAALRRIFQMDPDFQERMFAKQIAVMKGQAWNVVETLKTPDHGPLELTRRAKVCVWDDLVEVPIAVPMRATSSEIRRRNEFEIARAMQEEMDIGATGGVDGSNSAGKAVDKNNKHGANEASSPFFDNLDEYGASEDLLIQSTSPLPNPGRFELTKESVAEEDEESDEIGESSSARSPGPSSSTANSSATKQTSPGASGNGTPSALHPHQHQRRYSYTTAASRRASNSIAQQLYGERHGGGSNSMSSSYFMPPSGGHGPHHSQHREGPRHHRAASLDNYFGDGSIDNGDDVEGDLGYAAAEGMENNRRRVIVERLEPVKTKNPVFTWC
ncbi:phosphatidylinositol 4-kinase type ii subunit alpha [Ophiostoma piceae UAMH 11346]|uniref:Phosphatidylinositol 4-kinase n=1 Tax=Ophiostoma piceae (strain UAMH 11346) TaxID=1262450 RepID=S3CVG7_OPHP1|nr:phosphatidylinositol 4-kinase type ii subunit alpha [Ophiostoma piceae UAMH 11346]